MTDDQQNYTPSDEEVREEYVYGAQEVDMDGHVVVSFDESCARWDRFLARIRRDAAREALDGYAAQFDASAAEHGRVGLRICQISAETDAWRVRRHRDAHYPEETP